MDTSTLQKPSAKAASTAESPPSGVAAGVPPGYTTLTAFDKKKHAGLGLPATHQYRWAAALNAMFINAAEFGRAALDYPLVFVRAPGSAEPLPVAVLGLEARCNLFVDAQGGWKAGAYVPAYARRYPFCVVALPAAQAGEEARNLVCVEDGVLTPSDKPLLDARGEPTAEWPSLLRSIEAMEAARLQTVAFGQRLDALNLLTPFDALALPNSAKPLRLQGMFRVDEEKLGQQTPEALKTLLTRGELRAIYAHLLSLENFAKLLDHSLPARAG